MLRKFKKWYKKNFYDKDARLRERYLDIKNHDVVINGTTYFLAKAMIPDIPEILGIERSVYGGQTPWDEVAFQNELKRKEDRLYFVLRRNDILAAFIGCSLNNDAKDCHITNVAVAPHFQNHGLGYFLVTTTIKKARQMECKQVTLEVRISNLNAQKLYHDLGFKDAGIKKNYYYGDHEDALNMVLDLTKIDNSDLL
ncbi:ribosomal protein S18-alanine N-acetyltransferase [Lentilactobacillus laojiaonis]|uniref:ribosomal protein S18-alanine N-acetyltransferase n=1 Tax=Lentilactobacillus laojiaonis TaxID=2883998 RepID=UPI001D0A426F|nr:ribosomal protein S18-alanine N-acetyltransferase [Lentilactobacillus laojiaonis]UDM31847.1 ribosomal protein S18-alanine N-acetyltransferase [Lentilactobacillus laojiaonis]